MLQSGKETKLNEIDIQVLEAFYLCINSMYNSFIYTSHDRAFPAQSDVGYC